MLITPQYPQQKNITQEMKPHSDRNQGRKLEPTAVRIRIPLMYRTQIKQFIKQLKASNEYQQIVKRINNEDGD